MTDQLEKEKILFLDFDGPLFPNRVIRFHPQNAEKYPGHLSLNKGYQLDYWKMDEVAVHMLNKLFALHPFKTVVSSGWKTFASKDFIKELFAENGLNLSLHDNWATPQITIRSCRRIEEILKWLEDNPTEDCIILDDPSSGESICTFQDHYDTIDTEYYVNKHSVSKDNIIIVDYTIGMEEHHFYKMHKIVERWSGVTKEEQDKRDKIHDDLLLSMIC